MKDFDLDAAQCAAYDLLAAFGEDPTRAGLADTPRRVANAWAELLRGYGQDPREVLKTSDGADGFDAEGYDQLIVAAGIRFWSTCEHHLLPFGGLADVAYVPGPTGRVVGLSKIPRLVEVFARRLQIQERMTAEVADALEDHLSPLGVAVRVTARHLCTSCRGVERDLDMVTSRLTGVFRKPEVRAEFLAMVGPVRRVPRW